MHAGPGKFAFGVVGRRASLVYEGGVLRGTAHADGGAAGEGKVLFRTTYFESAAGDDNTTAVGSGGVGVEPAGAAQSIPRSDFSTGTVFLGRALRAYLDGKECASLVVESDLMEAKSALAEDPAAMEAGLSGEPVKTGSSSSVFARTGLDLTMFSPGDLIALGASAERGVQIQQFLDACRVADSSCTWQDIRL